VGSDRTAVVDLGTNSTRLLIAEVVEGEVRELDRRSTVTRLGDGVDDAGRLSDEAMSRVYEVVEEYRKAYERLGAERVVAIATSAVRDAKNGEKFREELRNRFGIEARILPGEEEARLTFLGATAGRPGDVLALVLDIGGGSTEFVVGRPGQDPAFHASTQMGVVRQTERHLPDDPPTPEEIDALSREAAEVIDARVPAPSREGVSLGIAVAGTATSLAAVDQVLEPYDPEQVQGYRLRLDACEGMLGELARLPLERRRDVPGLHPDRAPTIVAGAAILVEAMRGFGLDWMEVSEADLLHGAALEEG
jgi:exopolyphosphatase / guanosine-5'-triphosphate,3'-diphosphate pyrophosphatase